MGSLHASMHMGRVAALGCILCIILGYGATPAQVHHIRMEQGAAQRASDYLTCPLCQEHHTGDSGIHGLGRRAFERVYGLSELDLLAITLALLAGERLSSRMRTRSTAPPKKTARPSKILPRRL